MSNLKELVRCNNKIKRSRMNIKQKYLKCKSIHIPTNEYYYFAKKTNVIMKNKILFIIILIAICACQSNTEENINIRYSSTSYIDLDMNKRNLEDLSIKEEKLYYEARDRFGNIVKYENNHYSLTSNDPQTLNISPELFNHFKMIMNSTNNTIKEQNITQEAFISTDNFIRTRTRNEFEGQQNVDGFVSHWYGFELYLSNSTLNKITAGSIGLGAIASRVPHPAGKPIAGACELTAALTGLGGAFYPNGIIISFGYAPVPGGCTPYKISAQ